MIFRLAQIPRSVVKFPLDISVAEGRARVRHEFDKWAAHFAALPRSEPATIAAMNAAIFKGTQELIEVHSRWAQKTHFMRWFEGAWERENPHAEALLGQAQVRRINEGIAHKASSPFLDAFLTRK